MKLVIAIIQPSKLSDVKQALFDACLGKMTVYNVSGSSQMTHFPNIHQSNDYEPNLLGKVKIELAVNDSDTQQVINVIKKYAKNDNISGGKILVLDIEQCIRIRTGEEGPDAI